MNKKASIKDIEKETGISKGTIHRVLHKKGYVADETKKKVLQAVKKLNYKPNLLASTLAYNKKRTFATLIPDPAEISFWKDVDKGCKKAIKELSYFNIDVQRFYFSLKDNNFEEQSQNILSIKDLSGVVFVPTFKEVSYKFSSQLERQRVPFVNINVHDKNLPYIAYLGQDAYGIGQQGAFLTNSVVPKGKTLITNLYSQNKHSIYGEQRIKGFSDFYDKIDRKNDIILFETSTNNEKNLAKLLKKVFAKHTISSIFINNSRGYLIGNFLKQHNYKGIYFVGMDLIKENISLMQEGYIDFLISQKPEKQGKQGLLLLFDVLIKKQVPKKIQYFPIDLINKYNLEYYYI